MYPDAEMNRCSRSYPSTCTRAGDMGQEKMGEEDRTISVEGDGSGVIVSSQVAIKEGIHVHQAPGTRTILALC